MNFQYKVLLLLIPIVLASLIPLFIWSKKKNKVNMKKFIGNNNNLQPKANRNIIIVKQIILIISLVLLIIALARPQKGFIWHEAKTAGIDIVIAIDTSRSMEAIDVVPNRLIRAKMALLELSSQLMGDRIALIPFAGTSFVMTPFTADYTIFEQSVASLNTEIIPKGGTNLKSAINSAEELFNKESSNKILILITDGEDLANKGIAEAKKVAGKDVQIFTVGVGTKDGELIPTPNLSGGYLKDRNGNVVKSRLDEEALKNIAQITGGDYRHLSSNGNGILQIYKEKLQELEKSSEQEQRSRIPIDIYRLFLLPAVLLLLIEFVLIGRKPIKKRRILGLLFLINISSIFATPGDDAYKNGDYVKAIELLKKEKGSSETLYNLGSALYKNGQFEEASEQFDLSLKKASGDLQKQILYNLGNSYYRLSESAKDLNDKIDILKKSLNGYNGAIEIGNKDPQVQKNYDFVKKILDELEKQKKDQQKEDQQKEDQQKEDQQKEDQQKEDQQKEDQQKEDQQKEDQQKEDQQKEDQQKEDQQISKEDAEALLKALEDEDVQFQYLQNSNDNSYTGDW